MIPHLLNPLGIDKGNSEEIEDGSEQYPYLIKNVDDFVAFRNAISQGETFENIWHKLVTDIDLTGVVDFSPVLFVLDGLGDIIDHEVYKGNFEGNFKKIKNFSVTDGGYGLFYCTAGIIQNLAIEEIKINITDLGDYYSIGHIGGITAINNGIIRRCSVDCPVSGGLYCPNTMNLYGGGIAGFNNFGKIEDCWTNLMINTKSGTGIAKNGMYCTIERCLALGNILANAVAAGISETGAAMTINSVAAMNYVFGASASRIFYPKQQNYGVNNYALDTIIVNGATVTSSDTTSGDGKNATISQLKSLAFYRDTMGWSIADKNANIGTETWIIDDENDVPKLMGFT